MIDTLMVLWTKGLFARFLRAFFMFFMLFLGICVMLFLVTASGVRLPGLAVTIAPPGASSPSAAALPTSTPSIVPFTIPVILQNPKVPKASPTPALWQTPDAASPILRNRGKHWPEPTPTHIVRPTPTPTPDAQA